MVVFFCRDGLMFELENGKPKLILFNHDAQSKNSKKVVTRTRPQNVLIKSKQVSEEPVSEQSHRAQGRGTDSRKRIGAEAATIKLEDQVGPKAPGKTFLKGNSNSKGHLQASAPTKKTERNKHIPTKASLKVTPESLKESLVCLTQDQLQQILSTISQSSGTSNQKPERGGDSKQDSHVSQTATAGSGDAASKGSPSAASPCTYSAGNGSTADSRKDERTTLNGTLPGIFSTLGEREREKEALEAKRAQWKKELDEQMALRQQQKKSPQSSVDYNPWGRPSAADTCKHNSRDTQKKVEEGGITRTASGLEDNSAQSTAPGYYNQQDLPAAIRSAFVPGEATPVEHAFSAKKQELQRRWLQDLDQQREEAKLRRMQEKQEHSQAEDHERWAMHFDSLQKRAPSQPELPARSITHQMSPTGVLSVASEGMSPFGGDSLGRVSVDTTRGVPQRASYLRTMTALLDPAQIEERERKRLKQLEHQRAIEAQVEERRRHRDREEALRQAEEQAEEQKVARERELLQAQYQLDTQRERQKKELQSRKTEELYLSVQRAQQEALRDKQQQRIRKLARKGHDISKLLHSVEGESLQGLDSRDTPSISVDSMTIREAATPNAEALNMLSSRKDAAVQTDVGRPGMGTTVGTATVTAGRGTVAQTPDIPAEYRPPPNTKKQKRDTRPAERNPGAGKENVCRENGGTGGDPYEAFARTDRRQRAGRRAEWNSQRPGKAFVPASERYPAGLQRHRQESRLRRQMELLTLVEKNALSRPGNKEPSHTTQPQNRHKPLPQQKEDHSHQSQPHPMAAHVENRVCSPPVPALKHRLQQQSQQPIRPPTQGPGETEEHPPSSNFIPYVRTDEVYQLDPLAPLSRPSTQESRPRVQPGVDHGRPTPPPPERDPLLHPELLKNKERQQAILKGLSELRQGLLQKQRELETGLNPLLLGQDGNLSPHFQQM
ncbi:coiled-coil domain-containing protein 66 [Megalops cyprinoides]|uniref:coiled-coil domain-containing protein 66 n=1 Tax=Megalops cyprinoides TaxID=118141 RepID=UPI0018656813|nr:coiled-coil domain-containing protein 66 [Megalops cyprinoides]